MIPLLGFALAEEPTPSDTDPPAGDSRPSDDEVFGEAATPPPSVDGVPAEPPLRTDASIAGVLAAAEQRLAVGGQLYLRGTVRFTEDQPPEDVTWVAPALVDVYLDARPNDRVRAYARGRLSHDFSVLPGETDFLGDPVPATSAVVDQLWLKFDVAHRLYATVGRQRIKWGSGRFWNPTDFLNQQHLDPLQTYDLRTGVGLIKLHLPIESTGTNVYVLGDFDEVATLGGFGGAARVEQVVGTTEMAVSASAQAGQPVRLGGDVSTGLWLFDLHAEGSVRHGDQVPFWKGDYDLSNLFAPVAPEQVDRSEDWIPQVVAGVEVPIRYSDVGTAYLGGEFFYNDGGHSDSDLYPWLLYNGQFSPFYLGKMYAAAYLSLPGAARLSDHNLTLSWIGNLSDRSNVARLDYRVTVLTRLQVSLSVNTYFGDNGEFHFSYTLPGVVDVKPPVADVSLGALLPF